MVVTSTILPATMDEQLRFPDGETDDIIKVLLDADKVAAPYTKEFAKQFLRPTVYASCEAIFNFVLKNIPYKLDPNGLQLIKSPGRLWQDKAGDCKSFSLFSASILHNIGIPYKYRFVSFNDDPTPTHVYVVVPHQGTEIIIDPVWTGPFNTQKKFTHNKDIMGTKIMYLGSTNNTAPATPTVLDLGDAHNIGNITEGEMDLLLARQKNAIDEQNVVAIGATWKRKGYQEQGKVIQHCINHKNNPAELERIGDVLIGKGKAKSGKGIKKVAAKIKKGVKAITKVVTAPARLAAKGILEIYLPKAAFFFVYLFAAANVLPDKMKAQRAKAEKIKNFIVNKIGMKDAHFMSIINNNLTKRFGQSPEAWLANRIKGTAAVAGITYDVAINGIGTEKKPKKKAPPKKKNPVAKKQVNAKKKNIAKEAVVLDTTLKGQIPQGGLNIDVAEVARQQEQALQAAKKEGNKSAAKEILSNAAQGDLVGTVIAAISFIISKLGGKGNKDLQITNEDIPNVIADNANAFETNELKENYQGVSPMQMEQAKQVVTQIITADKPIEEVRQIIQEKLPFFNQAQQAEMVEEVQEGFEPTDETADQKTAAAIKQQAEDNNNPTPSKGWCS